MRLLLDAHVSARRIGAALRERGHDVLATGEERSLDGFPDDELLEFAHSQRRILVTFDVADFPQICREWTEAGRPHHGCAVVVGIRNHEFGAVVRALDAAFEARAQAGEWRDYVAYIARVR